jgi:hypothetical protein
MKFVILPNGEASGALLDAKREPCCPVKVVNGLYENYV